MRDILFRGKNGHGRWVYGSYFLHLKRTLCVIGDRAEDEDMEHVIIQDGFSDWNMPRDMEAIRVDPETVGEWTGLLDAKGKKIFEGDIVLGFDFSPEDDGYGVVEWGDGGFVVSNRCICGSFIENYEGRDFEVVSNIHDAPELLEE